MPISREWTAIEVWNTAFRDVGYDPNSPLNAERLQLINRAVTSSAPLWYGLVSNAYMSRATGTPTGDTASLRQLRVMQSAAHKIEIESSLTKAIEPVSTLELNRWTVSTPQNRKKIVYAISGDRAFMKRGDGLSSYGTLTIRYPRVPKEVTADTDKLDIPDDAALEIALIQLKKIIAERLIQEGKVVPKKDYSNDMVYALKSLYDSFGVETSLEEVKRKVQNIM